MRFISDITFATTTLRMKSDDSKRLYELQEYENESPGSLILLIDKDEMLLSILQSRNISSLSINEEARNFILILL